MKLAGQTCLVLGGATGLLGQALVHALTERGTKVLAPTRSELNITNEAAVAAYLDDTQPQVVFNAVAYTAVDLAEDEPEKAALLNSQLPAMLGCLCSKRSIFLVHYSTDFVFSGPHEYPLSEIDTPEPTSVYGQTKLDGEQALSILGMDDVLIIRTAWLFGPSKVNFVEKILGLARERDTLSVVHDQTGSPTYTPDLADYTLDLLEADARGLFHLTNAGQATWCELADEAIAIAGIDCRVDPVPTSAYPTKATRPAYSALDISSFTEATNISPRPWPQALREYVHVLLAQNSD